MKLLLTLFAGPLFIGSAYAETPSSDCARKFIGTWRHEGATTSNTETLTADGQAICSGNAFCSQGTWSCTGNVAHYQNAGGAWDYVLQPGGQVLQGPGNNRAIRLTAAPRDPEPRRQATRGCNGGVTVSEEAGRDDNCLIVNNQCGTTISVKLGTTQSAKYRGSQDVESGRPARICSGYGSSKYVYKGFTVPRM
ncbi:hypothetical protein GCM10007887_37830 [Methylobacterium haplocladii]|uniref:DUF2147 domain-containing protein n=2 Tax=Methylobacterium haplocladii TaxID=1176176 RepID=A0A512INM8_9HYPH|nr:hypothetical protein MHA02_16990 [Methylobacterium haplocladii]GLS61089.1 hypothetical protein GCM10007887_37830 [Methylobacterium haplocladii]